MIIENLSIPDVKLIKPRVFTDERGFFTQTYHYEQYRDAGIDVRFVQDNWSRSTKGVLRGLHYQLKHPQDKLVSVIRGEVFDVAVDIRNGSPTFGEWVGAILSEKNHHQLFVPKGFAHGFCVLSDKVDFVYKCSDFYTPGDEYGIRWNDPEVGIKWPSLDELIISDRDLGLPFFMDVIYFD
ncbi:dTDP-4-dehydrorhamnose 3,5-epimerase [Tichowtungia aerotolerans]|uniref:dTDP-4-dehydrorhamnose 3,5-epimerase n=1 Tax=Tichowtungia aerotolerans TaxID=2697043 RepID=A0A6P1M8H2_9BACT|nr:dTDP-4-dehydrorhamnose 3,5-epimerase [Tichowtungia aerotolerans]QHI70181.1 dTDP-4-dehydrorhamnose 3,5-epimerase [Tichowtungia aerotolerans]